MTFYLRCNRNDFAGYISSRAPIGSNSVIKSDNFGDLPKDEMVLVWRESPANEFSLPNAIVVNDDALVDFHAWTGTYFRNILPFSAQCRVLAQTQAITASVAQPTCWASANRSLDTALVIAESAAYSAGVIDLAKVPFSGFERSLSYAISRTVRNYDNRTLEDSKGLHTVQAAWLMARELAGEQPQGLSPEIIRQVWETVLKSNENFTSTRRREEMRLVLALQQYRNDGQVSLQAFRQCFPKGNLAVEIWDALTRSRESRVLAFQEAARTLAKGSKPTSRQRAFALGYAASQIQPGTFEHLSLLLPIAGKLPESLLWFGVFAGLNNDTMVDSYSGGLGWLLRRELGRQVDWLDRPTCDVALTELAMGLTAGIKRPIYRNTSNGLLKIEIYPLVDTNVRWSHGQQETGLSKGSDVRQRNLFGEYDSRERELLKLIEQMDEQTDSLFRLRRKMAALLSSDRQGS